MSGSGRLDHNPHRHFPIERGLVPPQVPLDSGNDLQGGVEVGDCRNKGKKNPHVPIAGSPEERAKLELEYVLILEAETKAAAGKTGSHAVSRVPIVADVDGTKRDRSRPDSPQNSSVLRG